MTHLFAWRQRRAERRRVQAIGAFLDQLEEHPFTVATMWDPQRRHAHYDLERVVSSAKDWRERHPHPAIDDLRELIQRPTRYHAEIDILSVTGVTATHNGLVGNLDALPETMRFCNSHAESFGPFDEDGMERLRQSVFAEFSPDMGSREGQFDIIDVTWSGKRIAINSGASRRFSLWRRLSARSTRPVRIHGHIHPIGLDMRTLRAILTDWRILRVSRSREISISYHAMRDIWPDGIVALNYDPSWEDRREEDWIIPLPHRVPLEMQQRFADLHAQLGLDGIEDVLRGVCESISLSRRSSVRSKPDIERPDNPKLS